ncbi:MAG: hypothetical protein ACD_34C00393G0001 [uncultured bacterium]|nr:MAG: hypothetical protein ACD_34C00393G0001 [uncultured bacterium]
MVRGQHTHFTYFAHFCNKCQQTRRRHTIIIGNQNVHASSTFRKQDFEVDIYHN